MLHKLNDASYADVLTFYVSPQYINDFEQTNWPLEHVHPHRTSRLVSAGAERKPGGSRTRAGLLSFCAISPQRWTAGPRPRAVRCRLGRAQRWLAQLGSSLVQLGSACSAGSSDCSSQPTDREFAYLRWLGRNRDQLLGSAQRVLLGTDGRLGWGVEWWEGAGGRGRARAPCASFRDGRRRSGGVLAESCQSIARPVY